MVRGDASVIIKQMGDIRIAYNVLIIGISPARAQARLCSAARTGSLADDGLSGWTQVETLEGWVERESSDESQSWRQPLDTDNGTLCS